MRKLLIVTLALACCLAAPAQKRNRQTQQRKPTQKEQLQQKQQQLKKQRQANQRRQRELEQQVKQRMKDVEALGSDIADNQTVIDSLKLGIDSLNQTIDVKKRQMALLEEELEQRRQQYVKSLRYMYRNRSVESQMMFIFSAQNFNQMYRRMRFIGEYTTYQKAQGEAVKQKSEQVEAKLAELNEALANLNTLLAQSNAQQQQLESRKAEQQRMVADLQKEQQTVKRLITQQQQEEEKLNQQIDRIIAEELERARKAEEERQRQLAEQRRREQEQAAGGSSKGNTRKRNTTTTTTTPTAPAFAAAEADRKLSGSFASNKGRLPIPITGSYRVIRGFGPYSLAGVTLQSSGIHLEGQAGAQARCVFDGEVSRVYNPGNGYFIMVRHGRYISVYGGLASVNVAAGQHVSTNQVLGTVGASHVLVFRLQNWDKLLNPKAWLSKLGK